MTKMSSLFGGESAMQKRLVHAISKRRNALGISPEGLDKICKFGQALGGRRTPTTEEFEEDTGRMTSAVFSAASFVLDLNIDEVLNLDLSNEAIPQVVEDMKRQQAGVVASCGSEGTPVVECEKQAPVYIILKALHEMDLAAEATLS